MLLRYYALMLILRACRCAMLRASHYYDAAPCLPLPKAEHYFIIIITCFSSPRHRCSSSRFFRYARHFLLAAEISPMPSLRCRRRRYDAATAIGYAAIATMLMLHIITLADMLYARCCCHAYTRRYTCR